MKTLPPEHIYFRIHVTELGGTKRKTLSFFIRIIADKMVHWLEKKMPGAAAETADRQIVIKMMDRVAG